MVKRYSIGSVFKSESVIEDIEVSSGLADIFMLDEEKKEVSLKLLDDELVYGLGESVRGINKRGWKYLSNNVDIPIHLEQTMALYGSHNFLLLFGSGRNLGIFIDYPGYLNYDIGFSKRNELTLTFTDLDVDFYIIEEDSALGVVKRFRKLIGKSYEPPLWGLGYSQSRWSYNNEQEVLDLVKTFKENNIPVDAIYLDIDHMERFKDFTVNKQRFPDLKALSNKLKKEENIHLVPAVDACVKVEEGYDVYEEGVKNNYFCKKENGENFLAHVWPGRAHFPDVLNDRARKWFGKQFSKLLEQDVDGFWIDMNEPSIFYTEERVKEIYQKFEEIKDKDLGGGYFAEIQDMVGTVQNRPADYEMFYHETNQGKIRHDKIHNLYGYYLLRGATEHFKEIGRDDILLFGRSSHIGMHRYGGIWTGDNHSWWSHIPLIMHQLVNLNICGFLYVGCDTGGFASDCSQDLLMRWLGISLFTPLFRNHSAIYTRRQEPTAFEDNKSFSDLISLRYAFLPYIYETYKKAVNEDTLYFYPLSFIYDDERSKEVEDQLFVGQSIMITPIYKQNAKGRHVYLPEDMLLLRFRSYDDYDKEEYKAGDYYVSAKENEILVFLRKGHSLALAKPARNTSEVDFNDLKEIKF